MKGRAVGVELFDAVETFRQRFSQGPRGYALDALDPKGATAARRSVVDLLSAIADVSEKRYPAVGLGEDIRLASHEVQGGRAGGGGAGAAPAAFA